MVKCFFYCRRYTRHEKKGFGVKPAAVRGKKLTAVGQSQGRRARQNLTAVGQTIATSSHKADYYMGRISGREGVHTFFSAVVGGATAPRPRHAVWSMRTR